MRVQLLQDVFPWHVKAVCGAAHSGSMRLLLHVLTKQMALVAFHVANQHAGPARLNNGGFQPRHLVLEKQARRVTPPIIIGQHHGDVFGSLVHHTGCTIYTQMNAA